MCEEKRDYSLLRKFDFKNATIGDKVCWHNGDVGIYYGSDTDNTICINWQDSSPYRFVLYPENEQGNLYQPPLCWVEGKPVYKDSILYHQTGQCYPDKTGITYQNGITQQWKYTSMKELSWTPRKVKKTGWINIYNDGSCDRFVYESKPQALTRTKPDCVDTIQIHWEE